MGYIYKITNLKTGKMYVGQTRLTVEQRWQEHLHALKTGDKKYLLYEAMRKCGVNNFIIEIVEQCADKNLDKREMYWIKTLGTFGNGYNMTEGGNPTLLNVPTKAEVENWTERFLSGESIESITKTARFGRTCICNHLMKHPKYKMIAKRNMRHKPTSYHKKLYTRNVYIYDLKGNLLDKKSLRSFTTKEREIIYKCCCGKLKSFNKCKYSFANLPPMYVAFMYFNFKDKSENAFTKEQLRKLYKIS